MLFLLYTPYMNIHEVKIYNYSFVTEMTDITGNVIHELTYINPTLHIMFTYPACIHIHSSIHCGMM